MKVNGTAVILLLSIVSYKFIESPFRNRKLLSMRRAAIILSVSLFSVISSSLYVYLIGGIVKDVPELGYRFSPLPDKLNFFSSTDNIQINYNERVREYGKSFSTTSKIKVLVIGNSFGRDFVNVLFESKFIDLIEVRYFDDRRVLVDPSIVKRLSNADYVFVSTMGGIKREFSAKIEEKFNFTINRKKLLVVGTKDFGYSNGIHYNKKRTTLLDCNSYRTRMKKGVSEKNLELRTMWGEQYIDLVKPVSGSGGKVLVFTPDCKFIRACSESHNILI